MKTETETKFDYESFLKTVKPAPPTICAMSSLAADIGLLRIAYPSEKVSESQADEVFKRHSGSCFTIGDFEIKCTNPEKYGL